MEKKDYGEGKHIVNVTYTRGGKTFTRKQNVGSKVKDNDYSSKIKKIEERLSPSKKSGKSTYYKHETEPYYIYDDGQGKAFEYHKNEGKQWNPIKPRKSYPDMKKVTKPSFAFGKDKKAKDKSFASEIFDNIQKIKDSVELSNKDRYMQSTIEGKKLESYQREFQKSTGINDEGTGKYKKSQLHENQVVILNNIVPSMSWADREDREKIPYGVLSGMKAVITHKFKDGDIMVEIKPNKVKLLIEPSDVKAIVSEVTPPNKKVKDIKVNLGKNNETFDIVDNKVTLDYDNDFVYANNIDGTAKKPLKGKKYVYAVGVYVNEVNSGSTYKQAWDKLKTDPNIKDKTIIKIIKDYLINK